jgi:hypothetical protein
VDPVSLTILFGAGALAGYAMQTGHNAQMVDHDVVIKQVFRTSDGWMCTELCNEHTLQMVGQILDLDLAAWWPKVKSGAFKVVTITDPGAPLTSHVVVLLEGAGKYGWFVNQVQRAGYRQVRDRINYQRIGALVDQLNTDPAEEVARRAATITDPVKRWNYFRLAATSNPALGALMSQDEHLVDMLKRTVGSPEMGAKGQELLAEAEARGHHRATPMLPDYSESQLPVLEMDAEYIAR